MVPGLRFAILGHHCRKEILATWLGHADARQVCDLPDTSLKLNRSMTAIDFRVGDPEVLWSAGASASHRLAAHQHGQAIIAISHLI